MNRLRQPTEQVKCAKLIAEVLSPPRALAPHAISEEVVGGGRQEELREPTDSRMALDLEDETQLWAPPLGLVPPAPLVILPPNVRLVPRIGGGGGGRHEVTVPNIGGGGDCKGWGIAKGAGGTNARQSTLTSFDAQLRYNCVCPFIFVPSFDFRIAPLVRR